ncbi:hypothetical protein WA158_001486 [Blastocystis sp. Blastoise]
MLKILSRVAKTMKSTKQTQLTSFFATSVKRPSSTAIESKHQKNETNDEAKKNTPKLSDIVKCDSIKPEQTEKQDQSSIKDSSTIDNKTKDTKKIEIINHPIPTTWQEDFYFDVPGKWNELLTPEHNKDYFKNILRTLKMQESLGTTIFPPRCNVFNALKLCPFENVKVVILGQDPYHDVGQAHGLSFSVPKGIAIPPSLRNIFQEISTDLNIPVNKSTDLTSWAQQGVLLLNTLLTVPAHKPLGHQPIGWETYTTEIIKLISKNREHVVFLLWGRPAQTKIRYIDTTKHLILKTVHPSPLSAYRGFFGCKHFSQTNTYLKKYNEEPINWTTK